MVLRIYKENDAGDINYDDYGVSGKISQGIIGSVNQQNYQMGILLNMTNDVLSKIKHQTSEMYQ